MVTRTKKIALAVSLGLIACSLGAIAGEAKDRYRSASLASTIYALAPRSARSPLPAHIVIPKIAVNAHIEPVGLMRDGTMDVPLDITDAAWFYDGPKPGENGNAVIDGHFGWKDNMPAVFDRLSDLRKGDLIYIDDDKGKTSAFVIREVKTYKEKDDSASVFGLGDGKPHLNLITCGGSWNRFSKSYADRHVVFSDLIE